MPSCPFVRGDAMSIAAGGCVAGMVDLLRKTAEELRSTAGDDRSRLQAAVTAFWAETFVMDGWPARLQAEAVYLKYRLTAFGESTRAVDRMRDATVELFSRDLLRLVLAAEAED